MRVISAIARWYVTTRSRAVHKLRRWAFAASPLRHALGSCGPRSWIGKPDLITGPAHIHLGRGVTIRQHARLEAVQRPGQPRPHLEIGDGTHIEMYFHVACADRVIIGSNVLIASRVFITDHDHGRGATGVHPLSTPLKACPAEIGDCCWLGEGAIVLKGVKIGANAVVGAGSVVTHDVPPGAVAAGAPARVIAPRANMPTSGDATT